MTCYVGWDVGGAHLKMACTDSSGRLLSAGQWATPLWRGLDSLAAAIENASRHVIAGGHHPVHAVTMTGELADCFTDRASGVRVLADFMNSHLNGTQPVFYTGPHGFVGLDQCRDHCDYIASANWYATASHAALQYESGLLIDIGTTTTDIIPFVNHKIGARGYSDHERLLHSELCYTGVVRTPVMAVVNEVPWQGNSCAIMNELFATLADVYRITGELPENADLGDTCDGAPKDRPSSLRRLARMIGLDADNDSVFATQGGPETAAWISSQHLQLISKHAEKVAAHLALLTGGNSDSVIVGAGCGRFLVSKIANALQFTYVDYAEMVDCPVDIQCIVADCAAAVAVAQLKRMAD
jgi:probable H4MPT-linked C1 transfer pathway protein